MSSACPNSPTAGADDAQSAAPPQSKLVVVTFPDEAKLDQAIGAILTALTERRDITVYRLATVTRGLDGKISVQDLSEESHGTVGAGALIGGLSGLVAAGPLAAAVGAAAGAILGWSAELVSEEAVTEFSAKDGGELPLGRRAIVAEVANEATPPFDALMAANGGTVRQ
jgi:outer membrane lipoprotein SlyB